MIWYNVKDKLPDREDERVLVFSPIYYKHASMRWRIINANLLKLCKESEKWCYLSDIEKEVTE